MGDGRGDAADEFAAVVRVAFNPIGGGRLTFGSAHGPDVFAGIGETTEEAQDGGRVGVTHSALVLPIGRVQGVMRAIFHTPTVLLRVQPLGFAQFPAAARGDQPSGLQLAFDADAAIDPGDLQRSRQPQFLGLNRLGDDRPILQATAAITLLLHPRGEGQPAGVAGLF